LKFFTKIGLLTRDAYWLGLERAVQQGINLNANAKSVLTSTYVSQIVLRRCRNRRDATRAGAGSFSL